MESSIPGDARHPLPRRSLTRGIGFVIAGSMIFALCAVTCVASIPQVTTVARNRQDIQGIDASEKIIAFERVKDSDLTALPDLPDAHQIVFEDCRDLNGEGFQYLKRMPNLAVVNFSNCPTLNDDSIEALLSATDLEWVSIQGPNQITNQSLQKFAREASLRMVMIGEGSIVSRSALQELKRALPKCSVYGPDGEVKLD